MDSLLSSIMGLFGAGKSQGGGGAPPAGPTTQPGMNMMGPPDLEEKDGGLTSMLMKLFAG